MTLLFELLGIGFVQPLYRGCPFINTSAEYPDPQGPVARAITAHRADVRALLIDVLHALRLRAVATAQIS